MPDSADNNELVLITEVGSEEANSYGTLDEMRHYFLNISTAEQFLALNEQTQIAYMIQAVRVNDTMLDPVGQPTHENQSLLFPRKKLIDRHGRIYGEDEIPKQVKWAQFEEARYLYSTGTKLPSMLTQGFSEARLDVMSIKLDKDFIPLKVDNDAADFLSLFGTVDSGSLGGFHMIDVWRY